MIIEKVFVKYQRGTTPKIVATQSEASSKGFLFKYTININNEEIETGTQDLIFILSQNLMFQDNSFGINLIRFLKKDSNCDFEEVKISPEGFSTYSGGRPLFYSGIAINNEYACNAQGLIVKDSEAYNFDENGIRTTLKDGYYMLGDFHLQNLLFPYIINPLIDFLKVSRIDNQN